MSESNDENNSIQQKVTLEFKNNVKKWIYIDDDLRALRTKTKELTQEKKHYEENILNFLSQVEEKSVLVQGGKLTRNVSKTKAPLKKELIQNALLDFTKDNNKANLMTDHIIESRPVVERINLKRTKNRK